MTSLLKRLHPEITAYRDRRFNGNDEDWERALKQSTTVYVGNLSFYTREEQIYEVFSKAGIIQKVIMGLDRERKTPCGFCFVIYYTRSDSEKCVRYLNGTILDERPIRVDHDWGFMEGRQWGRGKSGGQVRDEFRVDFDEGRGGFGKLAQKEMEELQYGSLDNEEGDGGGGMLVIDRGVGDAKRRRTDGYGSRRSSGPAPPPPPPPKDLAKEREEPEAENPRFKEKEDEDD